MNNLRKTSTLDDEDRSSRDKSTQQNTILLKYEAVPFSASDCNTGVHMEMSRSTALTKTLGLVCLFVKKGVYSLRIVGTHGEN